MYPAKRIAIKILSPFLFQSKQILNLLPHRLDFLNRCSATICLCLALISLELSAQIIPIYVYNSRIYAIVSFDGAKEPFSVKVDTGSSEFAVCPDVDIGNAQFTSKYACQAFSDGTYGIVGKWYSSYMAFYDFNGVLQTIDKNQIQFALIDEETESTCEEGFGGILGVDMRGNSLYSEAQQVPSKCHSHCDNAEERDFSHTFAGSMLNKDNNFSMAFTGITSDLDNMSSYISFGADAEKLLSEDKLIGTTPLIESVDYWFTLNTPFIVSLKNVPKFTQTVTYSGPTLFENPIIDTGVPTLGLPVELAEQLDKVGIDPMNLPQDAVFKIELPGKVVLEIPVKDIGDSYKYRDRPILGLPVFWIYDVKFNISNYTLSFYSR